MPSVWFCIPTANAEKCGRTFAKWKAMGYATAALTDGETKRPDNCDLWMHESEYRGWPWATNRLLRRVLGLNPDVQWVVCGGDDIFPVPDVGPEVIAAECSKHFGGTLGVMQPCGDRHMEDAQGRCAAERVCISPWIGRDFAMKWNRGKGPISERFYHFFSDEALKRQAEACGILWQRRELNQYHDHWTRTREHRPYLDSAQAKWKADEATFRWMEQSGFPTSVESYIHGSAA